MNKLLNVAFAIGLTLTGTSVVMAEKPATPAMVTIDQLPELKQEPQHSTVSERVTSRFERSHYRQFSLDASFSEKIFNRYLNLLDYSHNVLLASDIAQFDKEKTKVGEYLKKGELQPLYDLFNLAQKRRFERFQYALNRLDKPMDLTGQDKFELDRTKAPWPQTQAELDKLWDEKVKYDWLTLKLSEKTDSEVKETLTKRYKAALRRQTQSQSEDVFQVIMSAFAREIDPHTSYLSPRNTEAFDSEMSLSLEGIGAVLQMDDDYPMINSMVTGGPAAKSKELKVGDKIIAVGQQNKSMVDVVGWRLDDIVALIKGPKGSQVKLEVISDEKGAKPRTITLVREQIRLEDRAVKLTEKVINGDKVAILDIPSFYVGLTNDVKTQLQKVAKDNVSSLVIDLRGNGGGALTEAISLSGLFIPSGPVVQVRDNNGRVRQDFDKDDVVYYKGPLVVIVNRFSASASEIFAAAMQDYGRALIVGEQTFGKGTVQQYRPLTRVYDQMLSPDWPGLGSVQYTIQKFYRINGGSTQLKGVTPDLLLPSFDSAEMGESFEDNALPWDSISPASYQLSEYSDKLKAALTPLTEQHTKRIANDREFSYIFADIQRYNDAKAKGEDKFVILNFAEREKENKELEAIKLNRINERFKLEGKPALKSLDDLPKDYEGPDPYLDETAKIAVDLSKVLKPKKLLN
ncbi:carboxy terminal-processing peptidase [Proteus cibarius]|uniref:Carboxy terminal-processing peptidase n=1 Tax=Proteus terrae subsp. cibarius TaxID=626774 RepID=A0A6G6S5R8_9GAMM|nr:carboxy terminal-processing peptidase [Proteus terrae]QHP76258.1 carboxy terminal-processing peptidase [Proteus vulgaris]MBG2912909.1 carboxy terminal-processing peptidase [Proteus terrae subsp. cibarius]MBG6038201.1 carboxy terminal-processing peptidase [Proteus terrae subsp. cibarius]MCO4179830.1 carboxy terminal-processing peptidase [Proteus terrae]MCO4189938.1 carboxy terminal-processing peptidase [Proteus terrae]